MRKTIVLLAGMLVLLPAATAAPSCTAHLTITDLSPFTVRGSGFAGGERVTVSVLAKHGSTRRVVASPRGTFTLRLPAVVLGGCHSYVVRAVGRGGSVIIKKASPRCPRPPASADDPRAPYPGYPKQT